MTQKEAKIAALYIAHQTLMRHCGHWGAYVEKDAEKIDVELKKLQKELFKRYELKKQ